MMSKEEWNKALSAWENVKKQAEIDLEQSNFFIDAVKEKLKEFPEDKVEIPSGVN